MKIRLKLVSLALLALVFLLSCQGGVAQEAAPQPVDIILFSGQSNMAGRGETSDAWPEGAPAILEGAGLEYRATSKEQKLFPIEEPFGVNENKRGGIFEPKAKTGSMVTAFVNAYYENTGVPVIAISASQGGTSILQWQMDGKLLPDALERLKECIDYIQDSPEYEIRHIYVAWNQGTTDVDNGVDLDEYLNLFNATLQAMKDAGMEKMLLIRIGQYNVPGEEHLYDDMIRLQTRIAQENEDVVMVSCLMAGMLEMGLMKDEFHYYQAGYNLCGTDAGTHAAEYVNTGVEPAMEDPFFGNTYSVTSGL